MKIHFFIDGNGRNSRLLLNFELMKNGYPLIIILGIIHTEETPESANVYACIMSKWVDKNGDIVSSAYRVGFRKENELYTYMKILRVIKLLLLLMYPKK
ncbi:hypothetical protein [Herbivorax sp. ANBcel31]|uniref:hypothetical protein n=1 Tax=Herbivorax sp. ANBcel31 TaxID=3069754 RepID=UPI003593F81A